MTGSYRYPVRSLVFAYAGGGAGLFFSLGILAVGRPSALVAWVLAGAGALFLVYFARTVCRQLTHIELDEAGIRTVGPLGAAIRWEDLCLLRLDFYSTRRGFEGGAMQGGWMQLKLGDGRRMIRIDSELEGFAALAGRAANEAARRGLVLDAATLSNLEALRR